MSTHVVGFRPPDERWKAMKKVWDACKKAGVQIPCEVGEYFEWEAPTDTGVLVDISEATSEYEGEMEQGLEIDLTKLQSDVKIIRFYNSY